MNLNVVGVRYVEDIDVRYRIGVGRVGVVWRMRSSPDGVEVSIRAVSVWNGNWRQVKYSQAGKA